MIAINPNCYEGYNLFHQGIEALSDVEENGMMIDIEYCRKVKRKTDKEIDTLLKKMGKFKEVKYWKKKYGKNFNLESNDQLAHVLFDYLGIESKTETETGKPSTSQAALEQVNSRLVDKVMRVRKLRKVSNTYIGNYLKETVDNFLHPFFDLHIPISYRSSSSKINFQNQPTRQPDMKKLVRQAVVPRRKRMIGEIDFSGVEVSIAACYHKDPHMIEDIINPKKDMHRDMAMECYSLAPDEWTKIIRYCGKNKFVFPEFYGSYYAQCASDLWDAISIMNLETKQGVPLKKHLKQKGLGSFKKFEKHIEQVEDYFWQERYPIYNQWKLSHWKEYQRRGYVDLLSGFRCSGVMKKNEAINYPIQGAAFHCLLWCLITLNRWLKSNKMQTCIIGQIHDSIVLDIHPEELQEVMAKVHQIMTKEIMEHWSWIIIPLKVEAELTPVDGSWYLKKEVTKTDFSCDCGNEWLYETEIQGTDLLSWQCPVCGDEYEEEVA